MLNDSTLCPTWSTTKIRWLTIFVPPVQCHFQELPQYILRQSHCQIVEMHASYNATRIIPYLFPIHYIPYPYIICPEMVYQNKHSHISISSLISQYHPLLFPLFTNIPNMFQTTNQTKWPYITKIHSITILAILWTTSEFSPWKWWIFPWICWFYQCQRVPSGNLIAMERSTIIHGFNYFYGHFP